MYLNVELTDVIFVFEAVKINILIIEATVKGFKTFLQVSFNDKVTITIYY